MKGDVERRIGERAARQHGVVTRAQLFEAGLGRGAVTSRLERGLLRPLHRGVYLVGAVEPPRARHMAAVLASGPAAVLSHASAAVLQGLLPAGRAAVPVQVTVPEGDRGRRPGIRSHRVVGLDADERTVMDGIPITAPARTLLDLASVLGARDLERAVARAQRTDLVSSEALTSLLRRHPRRCGAAALGAMLEAGRAPELTRSEAEDRFLDLIGQARLPAPETNVWMGCHEVDFLWRSERIVVEVDGFRFHSSRSMFESDRRRDAWFAARGIHVLRFTWRQIVDDGMATAVLVGQSLAQGRRG